MFLVFGPTESKDPTLAILRFRFFRDFDFSIFAIFSFCNFRFCDLIERRRPRRPTEHIHTVQKNIAFAREHLASPSASLLRIATCDRFKIML
jgi:hypothetical protein